MSCYLNTGLGRCYDESGREIGCEGSGQDAEYRPGEPWPHPRFEESGSLATDRLTGLTWTRDANPAAFPLTWGEALAFIRTMNRETRFGRDDWRLPNRREMRSLISYQHRKPALPPDHPFENLFLTWYWTSTSSAVNEAYAWYVHLEGGRMFYGQKSQSYLLWPVCGESPVLPATGQDRCYDMAGRLVEESGAGQDGALRKGRAWPRPRFETRGEAVLDRLTGLWWTRNACLNREDSTWLEALALVSRLDHLDGCGKWRLPTINELESLVDVRHHHPALPADHPFINVREIYASSTTSGFEPDWSMLLHLHKGAVGVGQKKQKSFSVWAVCEPNPVYRR